MIKHRSGEICIEEYIAPASTAFDFNDVVTRDANGKLAKATATTPRSEILGLIQQTIASTDADYAKDKVVAVIVPCDCECLFEADVDAGTFTTAMRGLRYDLNDANGINVGSQLQKSVEIVKYLSSTKAIIKFVTAGDRMRLVSYQETITRSQFTDGGSTAGTKVLGVTIPAGATFLRTLITGVTGFAGDTSAVVTVGDGSDVDRYNTGTPSVFATAAAGADAGAPSGTLFHSADVASPTVTVTSAADFTNVTTGSMVVTLFWFEAD